MIIFVRKRKKIDATLNKYLQEQLDCQGGFLDGALGKK